jgi:putative effector of murein hydrolase LrgA (UPF0299 family)
MGQTTQVARPTATQTRRTVPWTMLALIGLALLVVLALGSYIGNWTWTGFKGNTLWDWLQLLILPVTLTFVSAWFGSASREWRDIWTVGAVVIGVGLIVLLIGGYMLNWTWTGFKGNTLWDWLQLLLLPVILTVVTVRISQNAAHQHSTAQPSAIAAS